MFAFQNPTNLKHSLEERKDIDKVFGLGVLKRVKWSHSPSHHENPSGAGVPMEEDGEEATKENIDSVAPG